MSSQIQKQIAETYHINHPEASYGIFCFNGNGDLFLNSDWGFYAYAWRSYGAGTFKDFLSSCDAEYLAGKFSIIHNQDKTPKHYLKGIRLEKIKLLLEVFVAELNKDVSNPVPDLYKRQ